MEWIEAIVDGIKETVDEIEENEDESFFLEDSCENVEKDMDKVELSDTDESDIEPYDTPVAKFDVEDASELKEATNEYFKDLKERSEFPVSIPEKPFNSENLSKVSVEKTAELRNEFRDKGVRDALKAQWENANGCNWPKYDEDVYSDKGYLLRKAGNDYDAHHIKPLSMGGENIASNITPLHASEHYDRQGIHAIDSPYNRMEKILKEIQYD